MTSETRITQSERRPLDVIDLGFLREVFLQTRHEYTVILTRFEARAVILKRFPAHDQVESFRCFDPLREHVAAVTFCATEQRGDLGKCLSEVFKVLFVHGQ